MSIEVSIIVLTYNSYSTIRKTLDSMIDQVINCDKKVEILVGDDCSTDKTIELLHEYEIMHKDLVKVYYNERNLGVVRNYYNLISKCKGKYIMECAGDDYWLPGKIDEQVDFMESNKNVNMCCGNAIVYNEKQDCFVYRKSGRKEVDYLSLLLGNTIFAPTVCIRKSVIDKYIEEVNPLKHDWAMEDYPMWLWISKNGTIKYIDNNYAVYRVGNNSISHNKELERQLAFEKNTVSIQMYFATNENEVDIVNASHLMRLEDIYLKYNCRREYKRLIKQKVGIKNRVKYCLSSFPGYTYVVNLKRNLTKKFRRASINE